MSVASGGRMSIPPPRVNYGWIGESWGLLGQQASPWIVSQFLYGLIAIVLSLILNILFFGLPSSFANIMQWANQQSTPGNIASYTLSFLINTFQASAFYAMAVKQVRGEPITLADALQGAPNYGKMAVALILVSLLSLCGTLALGLGLFVVAGLLTPTLAMVADGEKATTAILRSIQAMKGDWLNAAIFALLVTGLMIISALLCGIGLLATTPMLYLIAALAYRDMGGMPPSIHRPFDYGVSQPGVWPPPPSVTRPPEEPYGDAK